MDDFNSRFIKALQEFSEETGKGCDVFIKANDDEDNPKYVKYYSSEDEENNKNNTNEECL